MSTRVKIQQFGSKLSGMVIPNLGAFVAWGLLTAVGIAIDNTTMREFIVPMLTYLLPILIAFAGGKMVHDYRGGVIASIAVMGVILGSEVVMFIGAMIIGPLSAWILKKFDEMIEGKVPAGFELLTNNYSIGILGAILAFISYIGIAPVVAGLTNLLASGVDILVTNGLLPLTAIFVEPAKVLFLNNAIGQGIFTPIGTTQLADVGKSVMFLLESNPGPGMGILLAYMIFGKGSSKSSAYGAGIIHFLGGIHEIYFPFVLMNPILVLPLIAGGLVGNFLFVLMDVGLVGVASPGSIISIMIMSAPGDHVKILIAVVAATVVSFVVAAPFVKKADNNTEKLKDAAKQMESLKGKKSRISDVFESLEEFDFSAVTRIAYACDAGLGSSAMGATVLQKKINKAGITDVKVFHKRIEDLPTECEVVVTQDMLLDRAKAAQPEAYCIGITDFINAPEYETLVESLKKAKGV